MWKPITVMGTVASGMTFSPLHCQSCISIWRSTRGGSVSILIYHAVSGVLHIGKSTTCGDLGIEYIQPSLDTSGKSCLSTSCISSSGSVQTSGRMCHRSIQTLDSSGPMLDEGSLASHISQYV